MLSGSNYKFVLIQLIITPRLSNNDIPKVISLSEIAIDMQQCKIFELTVWLRWAARRPSWVDVVRVDFIRKFVVTHSPETRGDVFPS